ncbi:hypothetical protein C2G38_2031333 [Gigaspora rosea]|uniref:Peptidase S1 domain-containing protein n=1 Tax=Gigaspora rosea TaxID=44941 RepID=A0A397VRF2_9GLOM|nr:hypothetical protein C2G38_2031333 [Gigaspora rosea]
MAEQIKNHAEIRPYVNSLNFSKALNSAAGLNSGINKILNLAKHYNPIDTLAYIEATVNNIIIATCDEDRNGTNAAFLNATKIYYPIYIYYICIPNTNNNNIISQNNMKLENRNDIVNYILAGDGIYVYNRLNYTSCSAGFWAKARFLQNTNFIVTAGHCYRLNASYYLFPWNATEVGDYIGKMFLHYLSPMDFGLIHMSSNVKPVANIRNTDSKEYPQLIIKDHIVVSSNGAHLCISGFHAHVKCGYVKALSGFTTVDGKEYNETIFVVSMQARKGDSGGPVFSYNQDLIHASLNGILKGGFGYDINGDINNAIIIITPIDLILNKSAINVVTIT